jgi:hypothetical protein
VAKTASAIALEMRARALSLEGPVGADERLLLLEVAMILLPDRAPAPRCPAFRVGTDQQCIRPCGHPGDHAVSYGSRIVDWGHAA